MLKKWDRHNTFWFQSCQVLWSSVIIIRINIVHEIHTRCSATLDNFTLLWQKEDIYYKVGTKNNLIRPICSLDITIITHVGVVHNMGNVLSISRDHSPATRANCFMWDFNSACIVWVKLQFLCDILGEIGNLLHHGQSNSLPARWWRCFVCYVCSLHLIK